MKQSSILTVIETLPGSLVKVQCACGSAPKIITKTNLRQTQSCGCRKKGFKWTKHIIAPGQAGLRRLWHRYAADARKRGFEWELTKEQFMVITKGDCVYCGKPPTQVSVEQHKGTAERGTYVYNGIDRVDSTKSYTVPNCVACCRVCNLIG